MSSEITPSRTTPVTDGHVTHRFHLERGPAFSVIAGVAAVLGAALFVPVLQALSQPGLDITNYAVDDFNAGHLTRPERLVSSDGFHVGDAGWYLAGGTSGDLIYRVSGTPGRKTRVSVWLYTASGVTTDLYAVAADDTEIPLGHDLSVFGADLPLPASIGNGTTFDLHLVARNESTRDVLVLDELVTYDAVGVPPRAPPPFTYVGIALLAFGIAMLVVKTRHAIAVAAGIGSVVGVATGVRLSALFAQRGPLDPDAIVFRIYADSFQWSPLSQHGLFSGNFGEREPLFPAVIQAYFALLGSSDFHLRVVSSSLSIGVVVATVVATGRRIRSWPARLAVALLVALNAPLVAESTRGLRLELEMLLVLALYFVLDQGPRRRLWLDILVTAVIGSAMVLTRTYVLPMVVMAVGISYIARYRPAPRAVGAAACVLVVVLAGMAAHRFGLYQHHGDAFWDLAGYARWNANIEKFALHRPLPHPELFPTFEEYQEHGPYYGPPLTNFQYLLQIHSPVDFVRGTAAGYVEVFQNTGGFGTIFQSPRPVVWWAGHIGPRIDLTARWLAVLGLLAFLAGSWGHPRRLLIPVMVILSLSLSAFLYDHQLLETYRHTIQTLPLAFIAGAWLIEAGFIGLLDHCAESLASVRAWPGLLWGHRRVTTASAACTLAVVSAIGIQAGPSSRPVAVVGLALVAAAATAAAVGLDLALGAMCAVLAVAIVGPRAGAVIAAVAAVTMILRVRVRPSAGVGAIGVLGLTAIPSGLDSTGQSGASAVEMAITAVAITVLFALAGSVPAARDRIVTLLAAAGPVCGVIQVLAPATQILVGLLPVCLVAAVALALRGQRWWAPPVGGATAALMVPLDPLAATLAAVGGVLVLVLANSASARRAPALAGLSAAVCLLIAGSFVAAPTPTAPAWRTFVAASGWMIDQAINGGTGDSVWVFGRVGAHDAGLQVPLAVAGDEVADLAPLLPTDQMAWTRVPLPSKYSSVGQLNVTIQVRGSADSVARYVEIGGVYASSGSLRGSLHGPGQAPGDLSPDAGIQRGSFLIVRGNVAVPDIPRDLPAPLVGARWQPATGAPLAGEESAAFAARSQSGTADLWRESWAEFRAHPLFGLGVGRLADALVVRDPGTAPNLSARSQVLQTAAEAGLLGLAGLALALATIIRATWRRRDPLLTALLVTVLLPMTAVSVLTAPGWAVAVWLVAGLCVASRSPAGLKASA